MPTILPFLFILQKAIPLESHAIDLLNNYLNSNNGNKDNPKLKEINRFLKQATREHAVSRSPGYLHNPINGYHLLKRLLVDWQILMKHVSCEKCTNNAGAKNFSVHFNALTRDDSWPVSADLVGAGQALNRLLVVYNLSISDIARGHILDDVTSRLTSLDLLRIGQAIGDHNSDTGDAIIWLEQALSLAKENGKIRLIKKASLDLAKSYEKWGFFKKANDVLMSVLITCPNSIAAMSSLDMLLKKTPINYQDPVLEINPHQLLYDGLCRGDMKLLKEQSELFCVYKDTAIPVIRAKVEYVNISPDIMLYHDVIYENEMNSVREMAKRLMARSKVVSKNFGLEPDTQRISQSAWLMDDEPLILKLSNRVSLFTGLSTKFRIADTHAEQLQVLNYGLGGMYNPHLDSMAIHRANGVPVELGQMYRDSGDRIATWMFYLSDVKAGGATVFTRTHSRIPATQGGAAFWYNVKRNGDMDDRMLHAGCPVLLGEKWVANKWIREVGQAFRRRCALNRDI